MLALLLFYLILIILSSLFVLILIADLINFIKGYAPALPSSKQSIKNIQQIYDFNRGEKVADFGAGFGHILSVLKTNKELKLTGYELNPILCYLMKLRFRNYKNVEIKSKDFTKTDLQNYDVIIIYGVSNVMAELEKKILNEKPKGLVVISNRFRFKGFEFKKQVGSVFLYVL